jgi:phage terminase large subunit-like protein
MKNLREMLLDGRLVTNNNPLCLWYLDNVKIRQGVRDAEHENWLPTKSGRYNKIDGFAALLNAHAEQMRLNPVGRNTAGAGVTILTL